MDKPQNRGSGGGAPPDNNNGASKQKLDPLLTPSAHLAGSDIRDRNDNLIDQVRQIIEATPEVRPEKVAPLLEAVAAGTYEIDARKVANRLIAELFIKR